MSNETKSNVAPVTDQPVAKAATVAKAQSSIVTTAVDVIVACNGCGRQRAEKTAAKLKDAAKLPELYKAAMQEQGKEGFSEAMRKLTSALTTYIEEPAK